jgi:hypothetical protein
VAVFDEPTLAGPVWQKTLSQALDEYNAAPPSKRKDLEPDIFQRIIGFRSKLAKNMGEDERRDLAGRAEGKQWASKQGFQFATTGLLGG